MWLRIGMIFGGVAGMIYLAIEKLIVTLFAEMLIPGIGEAIMLGFLILAAAFIGVGAFIGLLFGNIYYLLVRLRYQSRSKNNI